MSEFRIVITTDQLDAALWFYAEVLERPITKSWDEPQRGRIFGFGDGRIEMMESATPVAAPSGVMVSIETADVDALAELLTAAGVALDQPPTDQPWGHRNLSVTDPTGLALVFFAERER